ncbi:stAR-related lipid transfer protein 13 isoform X2 [Spea bombifrons]|uniref:stAR-related lipid transfer protein 13 isoform X2 n=1 Tax=Spea bombifrons TaxID=233779 RepID=UPI00234AE24E|nr:stAR-related lipid transfer protein 13 isoform X2 [Spea bombifrons]
MTSKRRSARFVLRRSLSEQLKDSTTKAWDLLWKNIREKRLAELEAKEACDWLRAAGFPQYAQLYEDSQFPIDIASVKRDHDFLDRDHVEPLCRRLNTLNKCASMKLDVNFQRKKSEDSDEEDLCAISDKWTFQRLSRRWSRVEDIDSLFRPSKGLGSTGDMKNTTSSESVLTDLSEPEICSIHSGSSGGSDCRCSYVGNSASRETFDCSENMCMPDSNSVPPYWPKDVADVKHEKPSHTKIKTVLKCMETLRPKGTLLKSKSSQKTGGLIISDPVLQLEHASLNTMNCAHVGSGQMRDSLVDLQATGSLGSRSEIRTGAESGPESNKRGGMYLGDIDLFAPVGSRVKAGQIHKNEFHSQEDLVVHIPKDYKPGTFPKALSIESLSPTENCGSGNWQAGSISQTRQADLHTKEPNMVSSRCPRSSRISVYDNVPGSHLYASTGDLMDLEKDDLFPHLDDVLQHINGLQQSVDHWSRDVMPELQDDDLSVGESGTSVFLSPNTLTLEFEGNSISDGRTTPSDLERDAASLNESETNGSRERRDSGVGASLTRTNGRLRRPSFQISDQLNGTSASLQISHQTAGQLNLLQKFSLLHLTVIMEKYSMSNKHGWTWSVPKFMKRMKGPDYKDKNVFGVPLMVHVQRTGQPLPQCIQQALKFLRSNCLDQVGLFRKSGVKSRIQALRQMNETYPENVNYEEHCAYDVADMVKQFFRDLPEPLLTSKLGETFLHIYQYVPKDQRLQALQSAIMLMSDENREVLQTLLCFLRDVTSVEENQMTPMNLAVCLAPSLFHLNLLKKDNSPRAIQKKYNTGKPDQKDLNENLAATQGLAHMIMECNKLFEVPHEIISQSRNSYAEADVHIMTMEKIGEQMEKDGGNFSTYFENIIQGLLKEAKDKFKGWVSLSSTENTDLAYKKVGDGNPLRFWKVAVEVEAPPSIVLNRILREQHLWDDDYLQSKVIETIDSQTEVYQYVQNSMAPHPSRDFVVLRSWRMDLPKGMCTLVASSVEHEEAKLVGGVRAAILDERYLIEPCGSGKSRMTRICRVDLKGHCPEWYNKCFGHLFAAEALRIRNSFHPIVAGGPETKI